MDTKVIVITLVISPKDEPTLCAQSTHSLEYRIREGYLFLNGDDGHSDTLNLQYPASVTVIDAK